MLESMVEELLGILPDRFLLALQDDCEMDLRTLLRRRHKAVAGFSGVAGLDADCAGVNREQLIRIF